jgi:hypothetical protein
MIETCPPESDWSYDQRDGFLQVIAEAEKLVGTGRLEL